MGDRSGNYTKQAPRGELGTVAPSLESELAEALRPFMAHHIMSGGERSSAAGCHKGLWKSFSPAFF